MRGVQPAITLLHTSLSEAEITKLFASMSNGGKCKTTIAGRFRELDELTAAEIDKRFAPGQRITVHDIAVSNAITSVELFERLASWRPISMQASDWFDAVDWFRFLGGDYIFDALGEPLQVAVGRIGFNVRRSPWKQLFWPTIQLAKRGASRPISLFHPKAIALAKRDPAFTLTRMDFNALSAQSFDVVRLANATAGYGTVFDGAAATVRDGGLLVAGRAGHYTIFAKEGVLAPVAHLGNGFEGAPPGTI